MKYIQLNNTDLNISPICLGTAGFGDKSDLEKSFEILNAFVRAGGNILFGSKEKSYNRKRYI